MAAGALFYLCPVPPTSFIGLLVGHGGLFACLLPLSHGAVTAGTILWDGALAWAGFALMTGWSLKRKHVPA